MNAHCVELMEKGKMGTFMFEDLTGTITLRCEKQGEYPPAVRLEYATGGYKYLLNERKRYWYVPLEAFLRGEQRLHEAIKGQHAVYVSGIIYHAHMIYRRNKRKKMRTRK